MGSLSYICYLLGRGVIPLTNPNPVHHSVHPGEQGTLAYQVYNANAGFDVSDDVGGSENVPKLFTVG